MIISAIRIAAICWLLSFTQLSMLDSIFIAVVISALISALHSIAYKIRDGEQAATEVETEDVMELSAEPDESTRTRTCTITDVSPTIAAHYLGLEWPAWIEMDDDAVYAFDGCHNERVTEHLIIDSTSIAIAPGVRYKYITSADMPALAEMLKCDVSELTN